MSEQDIAIGPVGIPNMVTFNKKPPHLITLIDGKKNQVFLSLDKPESSDGFIQVKGAFVSLETDNLKYFEILSSLNKEALVEMYFPLHRVYSIQNLMFKAK